VLESSLVATPTVGLKPSLTLADIETQVSNLGVATKDCSTGKFPSYIQYYTLSETDINVNIVQ
jgi:hypothetical protein